MQDSRERVIDDSHISERSMKSGSNMSRQQTLQNMDNSASKPFPSVAYMKASEQSKREMENVLAHKYDKRRSIRSE